MDLWVVAAAAGAGYFAKYWQNLARERESSSEPFSGDSGHGKSESRPFLEQIGDKPWPFRRLGRRQLLEEFLSSSDGRFSEMTCLGGPGASATEMASTSGFDGETSVNYGRFEDYNILSLSSSPPWFSIKESNQQNGDRIKGQNEVGDKCGDTLSEHSTGGSRNGSGRTRSTLRSTRAHGYSVKPLSSLESCLIAQLYKKHVEMEEYVFSSFPSSSTPTVRPLLVTDGNRIISRASSDSFSVGFESGESKMHTGEGFYSDEKETVLGVPPLPEISPMELPRKLKQKRGKTWLGRLSSSNPRVSGQQFQSRGSPNGMFLFCLGITIGVMSTFVANKREIDKLNELLKQTENLVQDLHEELEMKDSLTMKELANEGYESQETNDHSFHNRAPSVFSPARELDDSTNYDGKRRDNQESEGNSESMSKIEAELEAELERLELNMNASSLERRLSGLVELDAEFVADIVQGELRADMVNGGVAGQADSDRDTSGTSTAHTHNANYAVSPQELSLRLHEVIQSRLEERIMELETALQNSQKRVHVIESKRMNFQRDFSNSEIGSSSQESPTVIEESNTMDRPLLLNLSGDALDAYIEASEEFASIARTDKEDPPSTANKSNQFDKERSHPLDQCLFWGRNGDEENGYLPHLKMIEEMESRTLIRDKIMTWEERISRSRGSYEVGASEEEDYDDNDDDDDDDEMGKLLIKQIVEKTRQGSPAVLNAQKMLFSMDEKLPLE